jgi:hypothetical protein
VWFLGLVLLCTMSAHLIEILGRLVVGTSSVGTALPYDFRAYSLLLLGVVLVASGVYLMRQAGALGRGEPGARAAAVRGVIVVLLLNVPLIPIQAFFAGPLSGLGGITLVLTMVGKGRVADAPLRT